MFYPKPDNQPNKQMISNPFLYMNCFINNALKVMLQIVLPQYLQIRTK